MFLILSLFLSTAQASYVNVPDAQVLNRIQAGSSLPLSENLNILVWNIHKASSKDLWKRDMQKLMVGRSLSLIEEGVEDDYLPNALSEFKDFGWWIARSFFMETDHKATGVITGSLQEPSSQHFLRTRDLEPVINTPKMTLLTTYRLENGAQILVANIHGINFKSNGPFERQIDDLTEYASHWNEKIIIAGDFNTWNSGRLKYLDAKMKSIGLSEVVFRNENREQILDHIYFRGCFVQQADLHSEITSSDHPPLTANFKCPN
jgi:endonuclease/exonuclease/phosphatase (EEP) superfamily protein YafD